MIRKAILADLNNIMLVIEDARLELKKDGLNQWNLSNGYPTINDLTNDILNNNLYVYEDGNIKGVVAIITGIDSNYKLDNFWESNNDYISIHRIAVKNDSLKLGIASKLLLFSQNYAKSININEIRIDTHDSNDKMKRLLEKNNFKYVGVIKLLNSNFDNLRNAYYKIF